MQNFVFLDIESTGFDASREKIIEIGCIKWCDGVIIDRFESLVNPHVPVPSEITLLTGITDADVAAAPSFNDIKEMIAAFIGDSPVVGHNIAFDAGFLRSHHLHLENPLIDTLQLARILLLKEPSYALEVVMKKYALPLRGSHRAMADTETTLDFFIFLMGLINKLPPAVQEKCKNLLSKTTWSGAAVFEAAAKACLSGTCRAIEDEAAASSKITTVNMSPKSANLELPKVPQHISPRYQNLSLETGSKILCESGLIPDLSFFKNESAVMVYSSAQMRTSLMKAANEAGLTTTQIKEPQFYISPEKLAQQIERSEIPQEQAPFLLKIIVWQAQTLTGDREEITLEREEFGYFDAVADSEATGAYWKKCSDSLASADVILMHHQTFARGETESLKTVIGNRHLVIMEASRLEESFTEALGSFYTESRLVPACGEKAIILFGLLGIVYEHFSDPSLAGVFNNVVINETVRASRQFQNVQDTILNLPDHSGKNALLNAIAPDPNTIAWITSTGDRILLRSAPVKIAAPFHSYAAPFRSVTLMSHGLSGDGSFGLIRGVFELGPEWQGVKASGTEHKTSSLSIIIPENFPEPFTSGYFKRNIELMTSIIDAHQGKALFLVQSKKMVEALYKALMPRAAQAGPNPTNRRLLAVGLSGGMGKSIALFKEHAEGVLLATPQILPFLHEIEDELETVIFQKIPFDPPSDALLKARASLFSDPFNEYTLPRAITKFREVLAQLGQGSAKKCYLLDGRLRTKAYGKLFASSLPH